MPDKKLTDNLSNNSPILSNNLSDSEIGKAKEVSLKEQIEHYNTRLKEVFDSYYRRNKEGNEDTLEICVLRESAVLISKLENLINHQKAELDEYEKIKTTIDEFWEILLTLSLCKRKEKPTLEEFAEAIQEIKAEAYKEYAEKCKACFPSIAGAFDWFFKELVGEDDA